MPVPSSINDIYTVAGSNPPGGGETPAEGDNHIRAAYSFIAALRDILNGTSSTTAVVQSLAVSGAAAFGGAVSFNDDVTIGNASSDALTINPNAITLVNSPTINGSATWSSPQMFARVQASAQPGFSAYRTTVFTVGTSFSYTDVIYGTEDYDNGGCYNASTGVFTAPVAGRYLVTFSISPYFTDSSLHGSTSFNAIMLKNGSGLGGRATLSKVKFVEDVPGIYEIGPAMVFCQVMTLAANDTLKWQAAYSDATATQAAGTNASFSVTQLN